MQKINVAFIMSIYSGDSVEFVSEALNSMIAQTYKCDIFIVFDGVIDDDIESFITDLTKKSPIFVYKFQLNSGLASALNFLLDILDTAEIKYDFVARMDADDICKADRIATQLKYFAENPLIDVLGTACFEFSDLTDMKMRNVLTNDAMLKKMIVRRAPFVHPTVMFKFKSLTGIRYPIDTIATEDYALWIKMAQQGLIFANIAEPLLLFRLSKATIRRRIGFRKATCEFRLRWEAITTLKLYQPQNYVFLISYFILRILPTPIVAAVYRLIR